jgi:DnaJ-domain-containing protein 1
MGAALLWLVVSAVFTLGFPVGIILAGSDSTALLMPVLMSYAAPIPLGMAYTIWDMKGKEARNYAEFNQGWYWACILGPIIGLASFYYLFIMLTGLNAVRETQQMHERVRQRLLEERLIGEERQRRLEGQRQEINDLVGEVQEIIQVAKEDSSAAGDGTRLAALLVLEEHLDKSSKAFQSGGLSYEETKPQIMNLLGQAEILGKTPVIGEARARPDGRTYYEILGVAEDAGSDELKKRYEERIRMFHPDRRATWAREGTPEDVIRRMDAFLTEEATRINGAYEVLINPAKRREYDEKRRRDR